MRLKKIKLAGFKSFVDPTTLEITNPLVAVVGPNGCGKSNVIDAIRWVMGESSAKNLRGESLSDVIFNGSTTRKPVGQATVDLVFDNSDGSLGGEYASYAEIAIRRQATRDNQSLYYLNGVRCRRRDITDIFLGTGLGPRSYAIIEQGMISRVIDAKPIELRAFFEEAAGISVYRKRRQETETRMRHTRENLARLEDVRQELEKQLERLKRQSESAAKYQEFKKTLDTLDTEVATLRWKNLADKLTDQTTEIQKLNLEFEEKMASRSNIDLESEKLRIKIEEETHKFSKIQAEFYDLGSHIGRTEQTLEHYKTREQQLKEELLQNQESLQSIDNQSRQDKIREQQLTGELEQLTPKMTASEQKTSEYAMLLQEAEEKMRAWNEGFEVFQQAAVHPQRTAEVEKARIEQLEKQSREANTQLQRLQQEFGEWDLEKLKEAVSLMEAQMASSESEATQRRAQLESVTSTLNASQTHLQKSIQEFDRIKGLVQQTQGRLLSLEALQQAALGKSDNSVKTWLQVSGLENSERLGETLEVTKGFERAVETVLGSALQAVCVPELDRVTDKIESFSKGQLSLIEGSVSSEIFSKSTEFNETKESIDSKHCKVSLLSKVSSSYPLASFLSGIYVAEDLQAALSLRLELHPSESVVTKEGLWFGRHWFRVYRGQEETSGILEREQSIKSLENELADLNQSLETAKAEVDATRVKIQNLETERESLYRAHQTQANTLKDLSGKMSGASARLEHARNRVAKIQEDMHIQKQKLQVAQEETSHARFTLQKALDEMQDFSQRREALLAERDTLKNILSQVIQEHRLAKDSLHQLALKLENVKTQLAAAQEGIQRLEAQHQGAIKQNVKLKEVLLEAHAPQGELQETLETLLTQRHSVEIRLNEARQQLDAENQNLKAMEKQRSSLEQVVDALRARIENLRIETQGLEVRRETFQEKLQSYGLTAEEVLKTIDPAAEESVWVQRLEEITRKIERLGAINLAAIEEYQTESERKNYLDMQHKDLTEALETLENAIRKIDRETRTRFKETFDKVNQEFQTLFPRLFGGGQSYLELDGEDMLEAGVTIMARPPGKRNSSIQLLSGGEKALTAVALVFSIFQLNPAPFCMLDEVDAPLDDANVGRFCQLVKHMSNTVQFIYVTHNKLSMEMAHNLIGVTMKEPGVSRLVSVDVAKAYELATA